jgi:endonuclease G
MDPQQLNEALTEWLLARLTERLAGQGNIRAYLAQYEANPVHGLLTEGLLNLDQLEQLTEAIIARHGRPGLPVQQGRFQLDPAWPQLTASATVLNSCLGSIGWIGLQSDTKPQLLGTGWLVNNYVITNRHVAARCFQPSLVGRPGTYIPVYGKTGRPSSQGVPDINALKSYINFNDAAESTSLAGQFELLEPIYLPDEDTPDLAVLRVNPRSATGAPLPGSLTLAATPIAARQPVVVVGYPAEESDRNPDPVLLQAFFQGQVGVKRVQPGFTTAVNDGQILHDCTTTGGNSGSPLLDPTSGQVVGVHYGGEFLQQNYAVPVAVLRQELQKRRLL